MPRVYVSVGSNVERDKNLRGGIGDLRAHFGELTLSSVYESIAVGFKGDHFFNLVVAFDTALSVVKVESILTAIEEAHGRVRGGERFAPRSLDLDLLLYGEEIINQGTTVVPREEITQYAFVLQPLAEIAGDVPHPRLNKGFGELWLRFDQSCQPLWRVGFEW